MRAIRLPGSESRCTKSVADLSHVDERGLPRMVDVSDKSVTKRLATARAELRFPESLREAFQEGDVHGPKGPVFQTAIIAGVMAAKRTHELIPFCHPLGLTRCDVVIESPEPGHVVVECTAGVTHKTGVEMEALTGASVAALTVYDMCKALSHDIVISSVRLVSKSGGRSGDWQRPD